jgi:hypothetical protein
VIQVDIDQEAADLLYHYAGPGKTLGRFLARLLYEHRAREEERAKGTPAREQVLVAGSTAASRASKAG